MYRQPYPEGEQAPKPGYSASNTMANSLLVADCGSVFTKVSLFGLVEGQYRLLARGEAPTTAAPPHETITTGIIEAIQVIESVTGRHFISDQQIISPETDLGDGVDVFIATVSAGGPIRVLVLGAVNKTLEDLTNQATSGLYAELHVLPAPSFQAALAALNAPVPSGVGSTRQGPPSGALWTQERVALEWERQLERIRELQPHAALIVGMADGPAGATPLQEACQLLINATRDQKEKQASSTATGEPSQKSPPTQFWALYAGAPQYVEAVRRMLSGVADVTRVESLVSPTQLGSISIATNALHDRAIIRHIPGYEQLLAWSGSPPVATATSLSSLVRFLGQHYSMNVTAVDVGGTTTTVMQAGEQGEFIPKVNSGIGVGPGLGAILQRVGIQRIARWLPFEVTEDEVRQFVVNRMVHPHVIPTTPRELQMCYAFTREAIILTVEAAKKNSVKWLETDLILATGGILAHAPQYGQVALVLLDALQPRGVTSLVLDRTLLISQLGAVATVAPITAVQVNENDAVSHRLGTCVVPFGTMKPGQVAVRVGLEYSNGRQVTEDVVAGTMKVIPLRSNEQALLSLFPASGVDVGLGPGERARAAEEIDGGLIGLIIDARGRPFVLPSNDAERRAHLTQWAQALGA
ncbi:MAG TPA: glutamate mutase L [Ktedonobacteraceae bacterium]|nr:glutamate mutase L [Ktedonobacteraceae bacterium]